MARRPRAAQVTPVTWRDGVHLSGTPLWCDARRRRDVCFVSSADRVGRAGHGQLIGTPITLALLGAHGEGHLATPLRRRFTLGTLRLELIPSGRGLGAAALHVDIAGRTVLYAGAVRTAAGGEGEAAEVRTCDALVVAAPYGQPRHVFPPLAAVIEETIAWSRAQLALDRRPVLLVDTVLDGLEVAARLATEGVPVAAARPIRDAAIRIATLAALPAIALPGKEPRPLVWLDADRAGLARLTGRHVPALVSARAADGTTSVRVNGNASRMRRAIEAARATIVGASTGSGDGSYEAAFPWSGTADRPSLLAWIEATGARAVYVTGASADAIVATLGPRARTIGPPHQMMLFPHEAIDS